MKPIIHIGFPKTATTWFQHEFFPNVNNTNFIKRETLSEKIVKPNTFEFDKNSVSDFFKNSSTKQLLICDEMLVGGMDAGFGNGAFIKEIGSRLKSTFPDAKIIIFIRNQPSMVASAYYQYIRAGGNYSINKFLNRRGMFFNFLKELSLFSLDFFKFDQTISFYKELYGNENVDVYLYEDFKANQQVFLSNFKQKYNLEIDLKTLNFDKKRNERYRIGILNLARFSNCFTSSNTLLKYYIFNIPKFYFISNTIYSKLNKYSIFGKQPSDEKLLGKSNLEMIKNYYKKSNQNLIEKHGLDDIKKYDYPLGVVAK
jgi:hypothetical protein